MALMLYKSLVLPIIEYGDVCYDGLSQENIERLQKLQNAACRLILRAEPRTPIREMHDKLELDYLIDRRGQHTSTMVYKGINKISTPYLNELFTLESNRIIEGSDRVTRSQTSMNVIIPRSERIYGDRRFEVKGGINRNAVPMGTKISPTLATFKNNISKQGRNTTPNLPYQVN